MQKRIDVVGCCAAGVASLALVTSAGCERAVAPPPVAAAAEQVDTPEGHLKSVMRRLEFALSRAKADATSGISSERQCDYKFLPPENEGDPIAATVTIRRSVRVMSPPQPKTANPPAEGAATQPVTDADATPEPIESVESKTYKLVYANEHWELAEPPQSELPETESICFQYALSDG